MANKINSKGAGMSERGKQNAIFQDVGLRYINEYCREIPDYDSLEVVPSITEQIGRMVSKPMDAATIFNAAKNAADALTAGRTVKQVEAYLRHGRTTGEWNETLLSATKEAASNTAKPVEGLTPADLIAIEALLRDSMTLYDILGEADRESKPKERRNARMAEMYADKVKAAYEAMTGQTFPQPTGDE